MLALVCFLLARKAIYNQVLKNYSCNFYKAAMLGKNSVKITVKSKCLE